MRIHRVRHTYRLGEPVLPWVFAIARRVRIDGYRRTPRSRSIDGNRARAACPSSTTGNAPVFRHAARGAARPATRSTYHVEDSRIDFGRNSVRHIVDSWRCKAESASRLQAAAPVAPGWWRRRPAGRRGMNCRDIDGMLIEGSLGSPFSTDVEDHVRDSARCQLLVSATRTSTLTDEPSPVTLVHIESRVIADFAPGPPSTSTLRFRGSNSDFRFCSGSRGLPFRRFRDHGNEPAAGLCHFGDAGSLHRPTSFITSTTDRARTATSDFPALGACWHHCRARGRNRPVGSFSTGAEFLRKRLGLSEDRDIPRSHCCCASLAGTPPRRHSVSRLDRSGSRTARGSDRHEFPRAALPEPACRAYPGVSPRDCSVRR
jgi:hypothetical protein